MAHAPQYYRSLSRCVCTHAATEGTNKYMAFLSELCDNAGRIEGETFQDSS